MCPVRSAAQAGRLHSPVDIPVLLAGNFGEPRPNHFHCGIDVKTQGVTGKRILAVADGYVSRMTVGYDGFGWALYITHPNGLVSVYCHLDRFAPALQDIVRKRQYEEETERVDVKLPPSVFPVKAGELVAYSGNTGASQAPHLHLELRRAADGTLIDPLPYFRHLLKDDRKPVAHGIRLYPRAGEGVVEGSGQPVTIVPSGQPRVLKAWGYVGAAIWADDYMNDTGNKFGVRRIVLRVDGRDVFSSVVDSFMPKENPMVNTWGDYAHYRRTKNWYLKAFIEPGNRLGLLSADADGGWVHIAEERDYRFEYVLEDLFGNRSTYRFTVRGERADERIAAQADYERFRREEGHPLSAGRAHVLQYPGMELRIPYGALAKDEVLRMRVTPREDALSALFELHDDYLPMLQRATLMLAPRRMPEDPGKCYIESSCGYVGGTYQDGWYSAEIRDLGERYALAVDTVPPVCRWQPAGKGGPSVLRYAVTDSGSGVASVKGYVDGRFVLFTSYRGVWTCRLDEAPISREGKARRLTLRVTDRCGNETVDERDIVY